MTMARETSMAIHSRADKWGSRVPEGGKRREVEDINLPSPCKFYIFFSSEINRTNHIFNTPPKPHTPA